MLYQSKEKILKIKITTKKKNGFKKIAVEYSLEVAIRNETYLHIVLNDIFV